MNTTSPASNAERLFARLQPFIVDLQARKFNIGVDSYCAVYQLLLMLDVLGKLNDDIAQLRSLIAPVLCSSEQEQQEFERLFADWSAVLQVQQDKAPPADKINEEIRQEEKKVKISFLFWALLLVAAVLAVFVWVRTHPGAKAPITTETIHIQPVAPVSSGNKALPSTPVSTPIPIPQTPPAFAIDRAQLAFWSSLVLFGLTLLWYFLRRLHIQRFLKRHGASRPPELITFFQNNPSRPFSSVAFARTAQQLHKHRDLDAHLLDVEATVKRTLAECGVYIPVYKAIKALPEYLVLIDRASYNDQLSQFVEALIRELEDFGLFIEKYYFDRDPRRCYAARTPTVACRLETLQSRCANHRLIIFSDSHHFLDPLSGLTYPWLSKFHEWQQAFLFTPEAPQHWDYYKQQLHEAGFVVLATGQAGLETLVNHVASESAMSPSDHEGLDDQGLDDHYPPLIRQRPRRFLERQAPNAEIVAELRAQLYGYLGKPGLDWLAACAVYPELHWQLTLYLGRSIGLDSDEKRAHEFTPPGVYGTPTGSARMESGIDETLLLKLTRLPWLRHGYMPDWLRVALLEKLDKSTELDLRRQLERLLKSMIAQGKDQDFSLDIAQESPASGWLRDVMRIWGKSTTKPFRDYVFQSFMSGRLAVKATIPIINRNFDKSYAVLLGEVALVAVAAWFHWFAEPIPPVKPPPVVAQPHTKSESAVSAAPEPAEKQPVPAVQENKAETKALIAAISSVNSATQNNITAATESAASDGLSGIAPSQPAMPSFPAATQPADQSVNIDMVNIPAGSFVMGCQSGRDSDCYPDENPAHTVKISPFQIGRTEVTQGQWKAVTGDNPSSFKECGDTCPVENVSWDDIQVFIQKLNVQTGKTYRLPTEAEWEYACRAGKDSKYCGSDNLDSVAWNTNNSGGKTHTVAQKQFNTFGLHDMSGNVWEWVEDCYHADYNGAPSDGRAWESGNCGNRVLRGGSWSRDPQNARAANRGRNEPAYRSGNLGFRLARMLP